MKAGVDWRNRRLISKLHTEHEAVIGVAEGDSEPGVSGWEVQQK